MTLVKITSLLSAAALGLSLAGAAQAATVTVTGNTTTTMPRGNDFVDEMRAAYGQGSQLTFLNSADITAPGWPVRLTFTAVGAESGLNNGFGVNIAGFGRLFENRNFGDNATFAGSDPARTLTGIFAGGSLDGILRFFTQGRQGAETGVVELGEAAFGVFVQQGVGAHTTLFLGFDDAPKRADSDFDDFMIRMDVAAVPVPAAGLLMLGALGGLAALRRRRAA
jgi:hypothetical protein